MAESLVTNARTFREFEDKMLKRATPKDSDYELESIGVSRATNGYTVSVSTRLKPDAQKKFEGGYWRDPQEYVYETVDGVLEKIDDVLNAES